MRSKVVPMREMREKYGVQVKAFAPAFVIPRHAPGWQAMDSAEAEGLVFRPASDSAAGQSAAGGSGSALDKQAVYIEINRRN